MSLNTLAVHRSSSGIAYRRGGPRSGRPPVLLLHGIPGGAVTWRAVAGELMVDDDVIVPDLLGFNLSERRNGLESLHVEAQAGALLGLLHELEVTRVIVIGHDFGAPTAVTMSRLAPTRVVGLGVLAGNLLADTPIPFPISMITWPVIGRMLERPLAGGLAQRVLVREGVGRPKAVIDGDATLGDPAQQRAVRVILAGSLRHLTDLYQPTESQLSQLGMPRFVAWGDRDPLFPISEGQRVADAMGVPLCRLTDAGHFLPQERPVDVIRLIKFLIVDVSKGAVDDRAVNG